MEREIKEHEEGNQNIKETNDQMEYDSRRREKKIHTQSLKEAS